MNHPANPNEALFQAAREWVRVNYPLERPAWVSLGLEHGGEVKMPVPRDNPRQPPSPIPTPAGPDGEDVSEDEAESLPPAELRRQILEAVRGLDEPVKGATLARLCGRTYTSHFRTTLKRLAEDGEIARHPENCYGPVEE